MLWVNSDLESVCLCSPGDLLLHGLCVGLSEEVEQAAAEVVRVTVWVPQLVGDGCQEQVATCTHNAHTSHLCMWGWEGQDLCLQFSVCLFHCLMSS